MPRKDPFTGVEVMTDGEFWAAEAEHEGKGREPWELMAETYAEIEREGELERQRLMNPAVEYAALMQWWQGEIEAEPQYRYFSWLPITVLEVEDAQYHSSFRTSQAATTSRILCSDGEVRLLRHTSSYQSGTYIDPPEYDEEVDIAEGPLP